MPLLLLLTEKVYATVFSIVFISLAGLSTIYYEKRLGPEFNYYLYDFRCEQGAWWGGEVCTTV